MIKNILIAAMIIALVLLYGLRGTHHDEPKQNEMVKGCVTQQSYGRWLRTCG